ncbi:MAG TPA: hypothetical protein VG015_00210, partial [Candidatus Dormibacteraeota bacterium]|nr:hypothetical protein [Candidatus Dormibacteraeota bacterium]
LAIRAWQDRGQIFWLADPQELCNGSIGQGDNGRLAADLLGIAAKAPVVFDEFHHGGAATIGGSGSWTSLPWGIALIWASIVLLVGLAWRGRRFGPLLPRTVVGDRSTREYTRAVGDLLRRSGGRRLTLELLIRAAARRAAERSGLSLDPNSPEVGLLLASRNPLLSQAWSQAMVSAATATASDQALAETARHLHKLAYPEDDQTTNPSGVHPPPPIDEGDDQ